MIAFEDLGCPHRRASFEYVRHHCEWMAPRFGADVVTGGGETKSRALNKLIGGINADVIVQVDPDSLIPRTSIATAIEHAASADGLVVPHDRYLYLSEEASGQVYAGRDAFSFGEDDCEFSGPCGVGNAQVYSRKTWEIVSGYDERFGMWGGDDVVFAYSAGWLAGPTRRIHGDAVHLWHPRRPESIPGHPGYVEQFAIVVQFRDAPDAETVRAMIDAR